MHSLMETTNIEDKKKPIKVYARVRPLNDEEQERNEPMSIETFDDEKRIKVIDKKHSQETTYYFDGVFSGEDTNEKVFHHTTKHLLGKFLNGINCALLTYGQTGSGKTYTLMADGCITEYAIHEFFQKIDCDQIHTYKITCSFVQVYLEKVFDLLSPDNKHELPVREHPKKGIYVSNLSHHLANTAEEVFGLFNKGKQELVTAETKMVRHSSRSHSIFQMSIERRLDSSKKQLLLANLGAAMSQTEISETFAGGLMVLEEDMVLRGKMDICDLAGSERLGKTMVEGVHLSEARHINSSLLELGNVIYALSEGKRRHIPFRNSTLTRLLQECLGSRCQTSFIVCIAPSASEAYETRCSLNFGTRARTITNKERMCMNVEVDYKLLAKKLTKKIELLENELLEARPIRDFISSSLNNLSIATETQTDTVDIKVQTSSNECSVSLHTSIDIIKQSLGISEMLEVLLENNENIHQQTSNYDTLRSASIMAIFTMATMSISTTHNNLLAINNQFDGSIAICDVMDFMGNCLQKMEYVRDEMLVITEGSDKNDLFVETAYTISEACADIENMLNQILKMQENVAQYLNGHYIAEMDLDSLYKTMNCALEILANNTVTAELNRDMIYIYYLLNLLKVLQIARLLLESSRIVPSPTHQENTSKPADKSYVWSTSVEETTSDIDNTYSLSSNEDAYFSDFSFIADSMRFEQIKADQRKKEMAFLKNKMEEVERINPPLQVKLNRSHSFKVKGEMIWKGTSTKDMPVQSECESINPCLPKLSKRKSKVQSFDYPRTQTKRFVFIDDGSTKSLCSDLTEVENYQVKLELLDLEKRYDELSKKYKVIVDENEKLTEKFRKIQQDKMSLMTELDYSRKQFETVLRKRKEHEEKIGEIHEENTLLQATLSAKEESNVEHEETVQRLQVLLKEKEDLIENLQLQHSKLVAERDENKTETENKINELNETKDELNQYEDKNKQCKEEWASIAEDILKLCRAIDFVRYNESMRRTANKIEDIASLETELFTMIEHNAKYEATLIEIRTKVKLLLDNDDLEGKSENEEQKVSKRGASPKVVTTRLPQQVSKKLNTLKKRSKKRIDEVRKAYNEQPVSAAKEIKACRASRVKELIQDKLKMNDHISTLEREVSAKALEVRECKKQIEVLVKEFGELDMEMSRSNSTLGISRQNSTLSKQDGKKCVDLSFPVETSNDDFEIIEIPGIKYSDLMDIVKQTNRMSPTYAHMSLETVAEEDEMIPAREVDNLKVEIESYKRKAKEMEILYTKLKDDKEDKKLVAENITLQRRIEFLEESNQALIDEIKLIKSTNMDRKLKIQELREKNNKLIHDLETYKRQSVQLQAKSDNSKQRLEKRLSKFKDKVATLENYSQRLEDELQILRKHGGNKSFNDSGLAQEDSDYMI